MKKTLYIILCAALILLAFLGLYLRRGADMRRALTPPAASASALTPPTDEVHVIDFAEEITYENPDNFPVAIYEDDI